MDLANVVTYLTLIGLGLGIILVLVVWTTKVILAQELDKIIKFLNAEAEKTTQKALENFRQGLSQQIAIQESRTSSLGRLYSMVVDIQHAGSAYTNHDENGPSKDSILGGVQSTCKAFYSYFKEHELFFSEDLCSRVSDFIKNSDEILVSLKAKTSTRPIDMNEKKEIELSLQQSWIMLEEYASRVMLEMKKEFAQITGQTERLINW